MPLEGHPEGVRIASVALETSSVETVASLDDALVLRAARGDATAFRRLYERDAPRLYRFLGELLRDNAAADEALQEAFVRAHARLSTLREPGKWRSWLYGIARLVVMEMWRARGGPSLDDLPESAEPGTLATPEQALMGAQAQEALSSALADLKPGRRTALMLAAEQGMPYEEIAEVMGWSLAKVKVEIHRARRELRARLSVHLEERS
jgi:RNA polymerase sigma-70 factor (ECF subfamily)